MNAPQTSPMGVSGRIARFFLHSRLTPADCTGRLVSGPLCCIGYTQRRRATNRCDHGQCIHPVPWRIGQRCGIARRRPAEQVLSQIQGLEHVYSVSQPGMAVLTVQYKVGVTRTEALVRLWDVIHSNRDWVSAQLGVMEPT